MSIRKFAQEIEASNEAFNKMSKAEKRVQIARDCLKRIQLNQFNIHTGVTCWIDNNYDRNISNVSVKEILSKKRIPTCEVCAKGGLFLSYVGRVNDFTFGEIQNASSLHSTEMKKLREIFEDIQLEAIETAFEISIISYQYIDEDDIDFITSCANYRSRAELSEDVEAMISICKNIIKNNGEFVPTDLVPHNAKIS